MGSGTGGTVPRHLVSTLSNAPILVTGSHRSGTTWLGKLLAASAGIGYIQEPFNLDHPRPGVCSARLPHWFMHLTEASGERYRPALARTLQFEFDWADALRHAGGPKGAARALLDARAGAGQQAGRETAADEGSDRVLLG